MKCEYMCLSAARYIFVLSCIFGSDLTSPELNVDLRYRKELYVWKILFKIISGWNIMSKNDKEFLQIYPSSSCYNNEKFHD